MLSDLYIAGDSPLHRAPPGRKLLALFVLCTLVFLLSHWAVLSLAVALVVFGYARAGLAPRHAVAALRPAVPVLALIFVVQLWLAGPSQAAFVALRLACLLAAAALVTSTTRASEFIEGILAGLKHAPGWVPKDKIALAMSLVWRFIPLVRGIFDEVREAQHARGQGRNLRALLVPMVVRTLKSADEIAEAIEARSLPER
ncbi:energy-coupling factor transporter transmembrane component T family protein [Celeribacter indicus]|uniref:Cobalt transport protein n=1 Tax=Celeribacter indicus TaxID=1208324 RepID=A0A0B5DZQ8_9RHOB|nr:energy-coupling factor transporter transmembrane protein EcfT [Celeribacter indicus]AJE46186.1 cobalt transport protein [Celeribacter indicus]SDW49378.1 biotin transport system permease protein [Celeribacter indicus]